MFKVSRPKTQKQMRSFRIELKYLTARLSLDLFRNIVSSSEQFVWPNRGSNQSLVEFTVSHPHYKLPHLFAYVVRQFSSTYESMIHEAIHTNAEGLTDEHDMQEYVTEIKAAAPPQCAYVTLADMYAAAVLLWDEQIISNDITGRFCCVDAPDDERTGQIFLIQKNGDTVTYNDNITSKQQEQPVGLIKFVNVLNIDNYEQILRQTVSSRIEK